MDFICVVWRQHRDFSFLSCISLNEGTTYRWGCLLIFVLKQGDFILYRLGKMKTENIIKFTQACHRYVKWQQTSLIHTFIEVIDDEWLKQNVLEQLQFCFDMLYELQKQYWIADDEFVIRMTGILCRQIYRILDANK